MESKKDAHQSIQQNTGGVSHGNTICFEPLPEAVYAPSLSMLKKDPEDLARQLWAVGDVARIRILNLLPASEECEHGNNVSQLAAKLALSQPTVSHHLRVLRQADLVESRKMCRGVFYWIRTDEAAEVILAMEKLLYKRDSLREERGASTDKTT